LRPIVAKRNRKKSIYQLPCQIKWLLLFVFIVASNSSKAQAPVPQFRASVTNGCSPLTVQFTDQSSGNPVFWNWDLGNGQLSTLQNPVAVYTTPGSYTITLVVRNSSGINSITKTDYIVVNPSPSAGFSANTQISCLPATIQFTDNSTPNAGTITAWEWNFGDGTTSTLQNPQKTYSTQGFYFVSLKVTSSTGCSATTGVPNFIRVVSGVTPDFSYAPPTTCNGPFSINFTDLTSGPGSLTYQWDFGNSTNSTQQSPIATYNGPGVYAVQLTATSQYGCSGSIQKNITISATTTSFNNPDSVCLGSIVNFQNTSSPAPLSATWDFGNGKQSIKLNDTSTYNTTGSYTVKLINNYTNCIDSVTRTVVVRPNPSVDFTAPSTIACTTPFTVNFQDLSPNAVSWQWNFGDGGTSTQQNPSHQYNTTGQFNVSLTIVDNKGCTNSFTKPSFVRIVKPTISVSNAPGGGCLGFTYSPIPSVNTIDGIASYFWDFGDGFTSTASNPSHIYAAVGSYTLKLVITTNGGCRDSAVYTNGIKVGTSPNANFTAAPLDVCPLENINFLIDPLTIADQWSWDFGDGGSSPLQNPVHSYADSGLFSVTLTAINNGCAQSVTRNLYVHVKPPIASFTYAVNCNNKRMVNFANTSKTDIAYGPISYSWDFGDGNTSLAINPTHTYASIASYTVSLSITNGSCTNVYTQTISLNSDIADFSVSKTTVCRNEVFTLTAINSLPANIAKYEWSYDGGPFVTSGPTTTTSFNTFGTHNITLAITDHNGCTDTIVRNAVVTVVGPTANFTAASIGACRNGLISFNDLSTPGNISTWNFDFGDGNSQSFTTPPYTHTYADTGIFAVRLTVTDVLGCADTYSLPTNILITKPVAKFSSSLTLVCPGVSVQFTDSSSGYNQTYAWSFGRWSYINFKEPNTYLYRNG
jgi:PKD repeat protein